MRRAPARPVRACFVREWCTVPKIILHTSHLHFTLDTSSHLISSELFSPQIISSLPVCHLSSPQLFSSEHCSTFLISSKLFRKLLLSERSRLLVHQKPLRAESFCTEKLLHTEACDTDAFTQRSLLHMRSFYTQHAFTQRSFCTQQAFTQRKL